MAKTAILKEIKACYVDEYNDANGYSSACVVDGSNSWIFRTFLKYDTSVLPNNAIISKATLNFYCDWYNDNGSSSTFKIHKVLTDWEENVIKWSTQPSFDSISYIAGGLATSAPTLNAWNEYDITDLVKAWIDTDNYGMCIKAVNEGNYRRDWHLRNRRYSEEFATYIEVEYEEPIIIKYLVRSNDTLYTVSDNSLVGVTGELNSSLFINSGVAEIPDGALLMTLSSPEVLCWTSGIYLPTLTATVTGTPHPQAIISDKIYLTDSSITGIESSLATCEGDLIVAVSFDDKQTWKAWNGEQWATLSDDNTGMSKETLEAITFKQWNELYTGATGFYVRVSLLDATQSVEKIVFDFSN